MRRSEKVAVTLQGQLVLVAMSPEERHSVQMYADRSGLRLGTAIQNIVASAGKDPSCAAEDAGLTLTAWVRDIVLHAVGYLPNKVLATHRRWAEDYVRRSEA